MQLLKQKFLWLAIIAVTLIFGLTACFFSENTWTPERIKEFEKECLSCKTFGNVIFKIRGFDDNEFDSILVRHYVDSLPIDSFNLFVSKASGKRERENKIRTLHIKRQLKVDDTYEFLIPGQKPYTLSNMKMAVWAQYTMSGPGFGCKMASYTIDTVKFVDRPNPTFVKRQ